MSIDDILPQPEKEGNNLRSFSSTNSIHERPFAEKLRPFIVKDVSKTSATVTTTPVKEEFTDLLPHIIPPKLTSYLIPWADYVAQSRGQVHHIVAAVVVMHRGHTTQAPQYDVKSVHDETDGTKVRDSVPKTLLVKRSWFDYMGTLWEVSGGSADKAGDSILKAAARELREETGLRITKLIDVVEDDHQWDYQNESTKKMETWKKFTFLAEAVAATKPLPAAYNKPGLNGMPDLRKQVNAVNGHTDGTTSYEDKKGFPVVTLDPKEHEDHVWASEDEVRHGYCRGRTLEWTTPEQRAAILRAFDMMKKMKEKK